MCGTGQHRSQPSNLARSVVPAPLALAIHLGGRKWKVRTKADLAESGQPKAEKLVRKQESWMHAKLKAQSGSVESGKVDPETAKLNARES